MAFQSDIFQASAFVTTGPGGADPHPGVVVDEPVPVASEMEAIAGYALSGLTRAGDYGAITNSLIVEVGGEQFVSAPMLGSDLYPVRLLIWKGTISITDTANQDADTGQFMTHHGYKPKAGQTIIIGVGNTGGGREFGGRIQRVSDDQYQQHMFVVDIIDWRPDLDKARVFGRWTSTGADVIFRDIIRDYCPGFSAVGVTKDAPSIPVLNATGESPSALFQQMANYLGWHWQVDHWQDVSLKPRSETYAAPLVPGAYHFDALRFSEDISQVRTRIWGIGGGGALASDYSHVTGNPIVLPMDSVVKYRVGQWVLIGTNIAEVLAVDSVAKTIQISTWMNQPIREVPTFSGVTDAKFAEATAVNIVVRRDNPTAIARMKTLLSEINGEAHDGIIEYTVEDRGRNEDGIIALADANLARFAFPSVSGSYSTWTRARAGDFLRVTYPHRNFWGELQIQNVISVFRLAPDYIQRYVAFTDTLLLSFNDLLRATARARKDR